MGRDYKVFLRGGVALPLCILTDAFSCKVQYYEYPSTTAVKSAYAMTEMFQSIT